MSTKIYPVIEQAAFFIDEKAAMFIILKDAVHNGTLQREIRELIDTYGISKVVNENLMPDRYLDEYTENLNVIEIINNKLDDVVWASEFEGTIATKWPEKCGNEGFELEIDDNLIVYLLSAKPADFFTQQYSDPEEMCSEFRSKLSDYLPDDFPFWKNIVEIKGTYCC